MAWAIEMKSLVSDIKTSTRDRLKFVKDNQKDTHDLLSRFDTELKEMAQDLKHFLDKSEKDRMVDFNEIMKNIHAQIKSIQERVKDVTGDARELLARFRKELKEAAQDLKDFLAKSEQTRMADFKVAMKDIQSRIEGIQKHVANLLGDYAEERKEAHGYWEGLKKKEGIIAEKKAEEAEKEANNIIKQLKPMKELKQITTAGSVKRKKPFVRDLDILASSNNPEKVTDAFTKIKNVQKILGKGSTKATIILKSGIQADIRVIKPESWGAALLYFIGSKNYNISLRRIAIKQGFKLSEYGLFDKKTGKMLPSSTEELITKRLGVKWLKPEDREM